jgi:hypothetical protein
VLLEGVAFETETFAMTTDSSSTYCLSHKRQDFGGELTQVSLKIQTESKGMAKWNGTVRWRVQDHNKREHAFKISHTLLVYDPLPFHIISTQHLPQQHQKSQERELLLERTKANYNGKSMKTWTKMKATPLPAKGIKTKILPIVHHTSNQLDQWTKIH